MKLTKFTIAAFIGFACAILTGCSGSSSTKTSSSSDSTNNAQSSISYSGSIAYIRMDSLMRSYGMFIDMSAELAKKSKGVEADLTQRGRSLEKEVADYQDKAQKGLITPYQARTIEEGLQKKNQEFIQTRDKALGQLQQDEAVMMNTISVSVMEFLKEYNQSKKYSMILQSSGSNPVLVADPALDITNEVLAELNKRYLDSTTKAVKQ